MSGHGIALQVLPQNSIVNVMRSSGCEVPEWMLNVRKPGK